MIGGPYFEHQQNNKQIPVQLSFNRKYGSNFIVLHHFVSISPT